MPVKLLVILLYRLITGPGTTKVRKPNYTTIACLKPDCSRFSRLVRFVVWLISQLVRAGWLAVLELQGDLAAAHLYLPAPKS